MSGVNPHKDFWRGKRVFLTGHTGFKGGWLALWLKQLGAVVHGFSLQPPTVPNLFTLANVEGAVSHQIGDIRDGETLKSAVKNFKPDIVLHLAAQPILRLSYDEPVETYATNVMGTVHMLEAVRAAPSVQVTLVITTDKCYENREQIWPYREGDAMGGHDPYSSSKGCAELVVSSYGHSYFNKGEQVIASARAGNVIGGGDWARDRLMTDIIAAVARGQKPVIRNPGAIRPWQHVLEPLSGYLRAVEVLWERRPKNGAEAWNFGPESESEVCVGDVANTVCELWGFKAGLEITPDARRLHEATLLRLDSSKARVELGWKPRLTLHDALAMTVEWYKAQQASANMNTVTLAQIQAYHDKISTNAAGQARPLATASV
ncbi:MAG: CDP-glucose 4,6-dehydratase [Alphaproteobacteria bacterium]|nr:CDP-glucose 4,6-dehydratase [Alphaproteobacteria bacterium]